MSRLSRRGFARLAVRFAALWTTGAAARDAGDRGLGGTGAAPTDAEGTIDQDRGIGGTGVVGTIRRFGSIVVNDLRVAYGDDVRVTIDGAHATATDLRVGQVVRVYAHAVGSGLATRAIAVTNEVVGPVEAVDDAGLVVLGQRILAGPAVRGRLRPGRVVAVAGLRRPDGTIVASLVVTKTPGTPTRLAGPVLAEPGRNPRIGGLEIVGVKPSLVGRRVVVRGRRVGDLFHASAVTIEADMPFSGIDRLSIEGYLARSGETLRFGSGLTVPVGRAGAELDDGEVVRAVVVAITDGNGTLTATDIHIERGARQDGRGLGQRTPNELGRPGAATPQRGTSSGSAPAGPTAPSRGGMPGSGGRGAGPGGLSGGSSQGGPPR